MHTSLKPILFLMLTPLLGLGLSACGDTDLHQATDYEDMSGAQLRADSGDSSWKRRGQCATETYYYVVEGADAKDAGAACDDICDDIMCPDGEYDAITQLGENYQDGDPNLWLCDCICMECDQKSDKPGDGQPDA